MPTGKAVSPTIKQAILITPVAGNNKLTTSEETRKALITKVKPTELGIRPDRILRSGKVGVRIECKEINFDNVNKEALRKVGLKASLVGKFKPRLAIYGVPNSLSAQEVRDEVLNNVSGSDLTEEDIEVKFKFGPRDKPYSHWVAETAPNIRKILIERERIYIGWSACSVRDHVRVIRCYKCQKFGHLQKDCKGTHNCGHCAGEHDTADCRKPNDPPNCFNCCLAKLKETGHEARSQKCGIYQRRLNETIANTDYGLQL